MTKIFLTLILALSLLIAPIAHAAGMGCEGDNCQVSEASKKSSDSEKQDNDKMANGGHHCCCAQVSAKIDANPAMPQLVATKSAFDLVDEDTTSLAFGPPLKPPYRA